MPDAETPPTAALPLRFQSASHLARQLRSGAISARALLDHHLARVDALNPAINAIVQQQRDLARSHADAADAAQAAGSPLGPLHGLPMTVKESFDIAGLPTTFGMPALAGHRAKADALLVQRLRRAGAVVYGKTNVPLDLADYQSYNDIYGVTQNPWRAGHTPGGSSGGSAAALAAGFSALELGSDIGSSIRNPAHFCGVFGHKPTYGLLPARGHTIGGALSFPDLAVVGPLARSAADLKLALDLLARPDEIEATGLRYHLPLLDPPTAVLRIAVWADDPLCHVSNAVGERLQAVVDALARAGAAISTTARPAFDAANAQRLYDTLLQSAMSVGMPDDKLAAAVAATAGCPAEHDNPSQRVARAQAMHQRDWLRAHEQRTQLRWAWQRFFQDHDFLLAPIMPTTAFAHDHRRFGERTLQVDGQTQPYFAPLFWAGLATLCYLPATAIPAGLASDGLPVGLQIIGPPYADLRTIGLAQRLEAMGFAFVPPPAPAIQP